MLSVPDGKQIDHFLFFAISVLLHLCYGCFNGGSRTVVGTMCLLVMIWFCMQPHIMWWWFFFNKLMVCRILSVCESSLELPLPPLPEWATAMAPLTPGTVATRQPLPPRQPLHCVMGIALWTKHCPHWCALFCMAVHQCFIKSIKYNECQWKSWQNTAVHCIGPVTLILQCRMLVSAVCTRTKHSAGSVLCTL